MKTIEAKLENKIKDFSWIKSFFDTKNFFIGDEKIEKERIFNTFKSFIKACTEVYNDNWDIDFKLKDNDLIIKAIVLHYPEITISNSRGNSNLIRDLFVRIAFYMDKNKSKLKIKHIEGGRTTFSYAEWSSSYVHSHLLEYKTSGGICLMPYFSTFCTGSGHISEFIAEINSGETDENILRNFFLQITGLVSWESLEGVPYVRISNIYSRPNSGKPFKFSKSDLNSLYLKKISFYKKNKSEKLDLDFYFSKDLIKVKNNDKLKSFIEKDLQEEEKIYVYSTTYNNKVLRYGNPIGFESPPKSPEEYIYNGKIFSLNIESPDVLEESIFEVDLKVIKYFKEKIENDINRKKIRQSTINRYKNKDEDVSKSSSTNTISM